MPNISFVFDLDETLADTTKRKCKAIEEVTGIKLLVDEVRSVWDVGKWVKESQKTDFLTAYSDPEKIDMDVPLITESNLERLKSFDAEIFYVSGRPESLRKATMRWIQKHRYPFKEGCVRLGPELENIGNEDIYNFKTRATDDIAREYRGLVLAFGDQPDDYMAFLKAGAKPIILGNGKDADYSRIPDTDIVHNWSDAFSRTEKRIAIFNELEEKRDYLIKRALDELGIVIDEGELLRIIGDIVKEGIPCERASIFVLENEILSSLVADGTDPIIIGLNDEYLTAACARDAECLFSNDVQGDPRHVKKIDKQTGFTPINTGNVPIVSGGKVIGVLKGLNAKYGFDYPSLDFLKRLGPASGQALIRAKNHQQEIELYKHRSEIEKARKIQQKLLPSGALNTEDYYVTGTVQECENVGGDVCRYVPVTYSYKGENGGVCVFQADSCGHGIEAALTATSLSSFLDGLLRGGSNDINIANIGKDLNDHANAITNEDGFITGFIGYLSNDGELTYLSAGHNPAMLCRNSGKIERLGSTDTIFGITDDYESQIEKVRLEKGDTVVVYTDGIPEACDDEGKSIGFDGVENYIREHRYDSPEELKSGLLRMGIDYSGGNVKDDMGVLVVRKY